MKAQVKSVYNDHPRDPKFVTVVGRWPLFRSSFMLYKVKMGPQNGGCCRQVVVIRRWPLAQVWLYTPWKISITGILRSTRRILEESVEKFLLLGVHRAKKFKIQPAKELPTLGWDDSLFTLFWLVLYLFVCLAGLIKCKQTLLINYNQQNIASSKQNKTLYYLKQQRFPTFFCSLTPIQKKIKLAYPIVSI